MSTKEEQDTLRLLVQHVSRAFYEPKYTIILDQLARHLVLKDDELAGRVGMQPKELNKVIAVLTNDALVKVHRQNELKEGAQRSVGKSYYYIDYEHFCNVVKWRIARMRYNIDHKLRNEIDNKGYICPQCKQAYTPLEADKLLDFTRGIFACEICQAELVDNENAASVQGSKDRMMRFNHQIRFIREGLQKSETMKIPKFDVDSWVKTNAVAEAEQRQKMNAGGAAGGAAGGQGGGLKVAGSGPAKLDSGVGIILVKDGEGEGAEKKRQEREREADQKRTQNALPSWHLKSTITGHLTALGVQESNRANAQRPIGDESLRGLGVSGTSRHRTSTSSGTIGLAITTVATGEDSKSNFDADIYDRYYDNLANASTPGSSSVSVAPTPNFGVGLAEEEEDRKPNIEYLQSLNDYRKRSRSAEDVGAGSKTPKLPKTDIPTFTQEAALNAGMEWDAKPGQPEEGVADEDPLVYVNGVPKALSLVTEEDHDLMTPEEYTAYFQVLEENP